MKRLTLLALLSLAWVDVLAAQQPVKRAMRCPGTAIEWITGHTTAWPDTKLWRAFNSDGEQVAVVSRTVDGFYELLDAAGNKRQGIYKTFEAAKCGLNRRIVENSKK